MYDSILAVVQSSEEKLVRMVHGGPPEFSIGLKVPINNGDVAFLIEEIYKGRSAITGLTSRLVLIRWGKVNDSSLIQIGSQKSSSLQLWDLVCMTKEEAARHQKEVLQGDKTLEDIYDSATIQRIEAYRKDAQTYQKYR